MRLLEEELGVELFGRNGKHLTEVTPIGRQIITKAESILREVNNIQILAEEYRDDRRGSLSIATTHTQARYALPPVIKIFRERYPAVTLQIHQGSPAPVSYTHLDVYKRQNIHWMRLGAISRPGILLLPVAMVM